MEFGSLKYGLPRRSAPRNDVLCLPAPRYTSLRAPEGGVAIYITNIALYFYDNFCI